MLRSWESWLLKGWVSLSSPWEGQGPSSSAPWRGGTPGNGGGSHVQLHFQHRVSVEHLHTAHLPLGWNPHFTAPGGEKLPQCSPQTPPGPSTDPGSWGSPDLFWSHSALSTLFPKQELSDSPLCARWEQQLFQHGLEMETASRGAHQH